MLSLESLLEILLGISLSAAAGFRVFVPLLVLSATSVLTHFDYPSEFDWVESPQALVVFAVACLLEVGGYYIPWFDHLLDIVATPAAVVVGTLVAASVTPDINPIAQWTLAIVAGGGTAGLTKGLLNIFRITSTGISGGLTNPILATIELVMALAVSISALVLPFFTGLVIIGGLIVAILMLRKFLMRQTSPAQAASTMKEL